MNDSFLDRFQAEASDVLASIFAHSGDCIKLLTLDGRLEYVSDSACGTLGLASASEARGRDWLAMWPPGERARLRETLAMAAAGQGARFQGTMGEGADRRCWDVAISPVRGTGGAITHLLAVSTETTALVEAARQEKKRREQAERETTHAATVAGELRHRLKNQLAVVAAVAKLLARHSTGARELAGKLEAKLIALSHAQDLVTAHHEEPMSAQHAVREVLRASGAGDRIEVEAMPPARLPDASVQQLALILGELQTNALKHGALLGGGGRVTVSGRKGDGALSLRWEEDCGKPVAPVEAGHGGFQLIRRLGSAGKLKPEIAWQATGIVVEFHVRAV